MKNSKTIFVPLVWVLYQVFTRFPSGVRRTCIERVISYSWKKRLDKTKKNIQLLHSDLNNNQIDQVIRRLKKITIENYAFLSGSKSLDIKKEINNLELTGEIEQTLNHYRGGKKIIILSPHMGPHDKAMILTARELEKRLRRLPLRVFVLAENIPIFDTATNDLRKIAGKNFHFERIKKGETLIKAAEYINKGYIVVFGFDIVRDNGSGVICPIGDNAQGFFPAGWAKLALREDAIIIPLFPSCGEEGKVKVVVGSPFELEKTDDEEKDIENNVRRLVKLYDPFFREHPGEWLRLPHSDLESAKM